jgi:hypothetical protein
MPGVHSERLLCIAIEQDVIAGSREVLFQAATNIIQTLLNGTKASQSPRAAPEERLSDWHGLCACFAMFNVIGGVDPARRRCCGSERAPPCSPHDSILMSFIIPELLDLKNFRGEYRGQS